MHANQNRLVRLLLLSLFVCVSCNSNVIYSGSEEMDKSKWSLMDVLAFDFESTDTLISNNVVFTIRTGSQYPFRNIYLFVTTTSPDGKTIGDTLNYYLADEKGNWAGKGVGDVHSLDLPYKSNVFFPQKGIYRFRVQHGMRTEELEGVYDFGLRVEKVKK